MLVPANISSGGVLRDSGTTASSLTSAISGLSDENYMKSWLVLHTTNRTRDVILRPKWGASAAKNYSAFEFAQASGENQNLQEISFVATSGLTIIKYFLGQSSWTVPTDTVTFWELYY